MTFGHILIGVAAARGLWSIQYLIQTPVFFNFWLCETNTPYSAQNIGYLTAINLKTIQTGGRTVLLRGRKMLTAVQPGGKNLTSIAHAPWKRSPFIKKYLKQKFRMETLIFCGKNTLQDYHNLISNHVDLQIFFAFDINCFHFY